MYVHQYLSHLQNIVILNKKQWNFVIRFIHRDSLDNYFITRMNGSEIV